MHIRLATFVAMLSTALVICPFASRASAQHRPQPVAEFTAGRVLFADDGIVTETSVGGTTRFYVLPRVSVGPEITYIAGNNHSHLLLTGNVTFDLVAPRADQPRRVTPYIVAGGGMYRTRERFFNDSFASIEGTVAVGGGVRALVGERVFVGGEARVGWEPHIRFAGMVGVRLGREGSGASRATSALSRGVVWLLAWRAGRCLC